MNARLVALLVLTTLALTGGALFGIAQVVRGPGTRIDAGGPGATPTTLIERTATTTQGTKPPSTTTPPTAAPTTKPPTTTTTAALTTTTTRPPTTAAKSSGQAVKPGEGPIDPAGEKAINEAYAAYGGAGGPLGPVESHIYCGLKNGGCGQRYNHGTMFWSPATGAWPSQSPTLDKYKELNWENSYLGYPVSETYCDLPDNGCGQRFENGTMFSTKSTGTRIVRGKLLDYYEKQGWERGSLGYPVSDEAEVVRNGQKGVEQRFQKGTLFYAPSVGVQRT